MADALLEELSRDPARKIVYVRVDEPSEPPLGSRVEEVVENEQLVRLLRRRGIQRLYKFQEEAIAYIRRGLSTFIVAGTGMGKTEAFLIPILEDIAKDPFSGVRALFIYPTKALARDQLARINYYASAFFGVRAATYDGDVSISDRKRIYASPPPILVLNPDIIHVSLMFSEDFRNMISNVRYVVLDDVHVYSGVFGAHVAYVMRRLRRFLSEAPVFIAASATVGNPSAIAQKLFGVDAKVVRAGNSVRGRVFHVFVKPEGRSKLLEVVAILRKTIELGLKTVVFVDSHKLAEMAKVLAKRYGLPVSIHRAGLSPRERAKVEEGLREGSIRAVVATPTLELGIDIGDLDVVVLYSIPPTFSRYVQRTGRVGRRGQTSYVITLLGDDPISSYYERHPEEFFSQGFTEQPLDLWNEEVAKLHLIAMACDKPVKPDELSEFEAQVADRLVSEGFLSVKGGELIPTYRGARYVRRRLSLRGIGDVVSIVTDTGKKIGEREMPMALRELHPGAIYYHGGTPFLVIELRRRRAVVKRIGDLGLVTSPLYYSLPTNERVIEYRVVKGLRVEYMELSITEAVYGYVVKRFPGRGVLREEVLDREYTYSFKTKGVLLRFPPREDWGEMENAEAFHAVEHALISAAEMLLGAAPTDLGGVSFPSGHIYIYDSYSGGSGVSQMLLRSMEKALEMAYKIVSECKCRDGCPMCIYSPYCGNNNKFLSRRRAAEVLELAMRGELKYTPEARYGKPIV